MTDTTTKTPIDWQLCLELTEGDEKLAEMFLDLLVKRLPQDLAEIQQSMLDKNWLQLSDLAHKFRSGCCYCGVPQLKQLANTLEKQAESNDVAQIPAIFSQFEQEAARVIESFQQDNYQMT